MLAKQLKYLSGHRKDILESIHLIIIDDGSHRFPILDTCAPPRELASFSLYRILVDIRWNWIAARNLGVEHAISEWVLLTDIDHIPSSAALDMAINADLDPQVVYRFRRRIAPWMLPYRSHPNSWLLTKSMFDSVGGYDERFSGTYGSDGEFRKRIRATAKSTIILPAHLTAYTSLSVPDAATRLYKRKLPQDRVEKKRIMKLIKESPKPHRLTFPWSKVN